MLIKCPECGREISDKTSSCPNCGCPSSEWVTASKTISNGISKDGASQKRDMLYEQTQINQWWTDNKRNSNFLFYPPVGGSETATVMCKKCGSISSISMRNVEKRGNLYCININFPCAYCQEQISAGTILESVSVTPAPAAQQMQKQNMTSPTQAMDHKKKKKIPTVLIASAVVILLVLLFRTPASTNNSRNSAIWRTNSQNSTSYVEVQDTTTIGQKNALREANSYLRTMPFSKNGLINQLEYEGYSHEDAVYAVERCGADWNEQAALQAASYLRTMPFSKDGLIEQLEYEGFTHEQAVYGVEQNGY